jgi:predicted O-methyltransferase YrrM
LEPLLHDLLTRTVRERRPRRVLDIGCGAGLHLAAMLDAAPDATGVGVDVDPDAAALARRTLSERGLADRASVEAVDIRKALAAGRPGALPDRIDLALLANVIYYVPVDERVELLSAVARLLAPGGALVVVTTVAGPQLFSRHLDLLLRAQEGRMELPAVDLLLGQLREAGLQPDPPERIGPAGAALSAVTAIR